eukprot:COSAG01_NODE_30579_length_613_cov_1.287938_1_plen_31_part_10
MWLTAPFCNPNRYINIGSLDLFLDEDVGYAM